MTLILLNNDKLNFTLKFNTIITTLDQLREFNLKFLYSI